MRAFIKAFLMGSIFCTLGWMSVALAEQEPVFSFEVWKAKQVEAAQITFNVAKMDMNLRNRSTQKAEAQSLALQARVDQARLHLEVAKELGLHDYFVLYAAQLRSTEDFKRVVSSLSQEEATMLLRAYAERLTHQQGGATTAQLRPEIFPGNQ